MTVELIRGNHTRRQCAQCQTFFRVWHYHPHQRYCSLRCFGLAHHPRRLVDRECAACGVAFRPRKSVRVLCSMACAAGWRWNPKRLERAS